MNTNDNQAVALSPESQKAIQAQQVKTKVEELLGISRLTVNTLNLICSNDVKIPSAYAKPVAEIQSWLEGMHQNVQNNINVLKPLLAPEDAERLFGKAVPQTQEKSVVVDQATPKAVTLEAITPA